MPFQNALRTDEYFKHIANDNSTEFWAFHKLKGTNTDAVSEEVKSLMFSLLSKEPTIRPSIPEILSH